MVLSTVQKKVYDQPHTVALSFLPYAAGKMNKLIFLPWGYTMYIQKEVLIMQAQVKTWGNSQGIRIPKEVLQEAVLFQLMMFSMSRYLMA